VTDIVRSELIHIIKSINNLNFFANFYSVITALKMSLVLMLLKQFP